LNAVPVQSSLECCSTSPNLPDCDKTLAKLESCVHRPSTLEGVKLCPDWAGEALTIVLRVALLAAQCHMMYRTPCHLPQMWHWLVTAMTTGVVVNHCSILLGASGRGSRTGGAAAGLSEGAARCAAHHQPRIGIQAVEGRHCNCKRLHSASQMEPRSRQIKLHSLNLKSGRVDDGSFGHGTVTLLACHWQNAHRTYFMPAAFLSAHQRAAPADWSPTADAPLQHQLSAYLVTLLSMMRVQHDTCIAGYQKQKQVTNNADNSPSFPSTSWGGGTPSEAGSSRMIFRRFP
jgi:hypothetical protein